jgi:hypothetical protein
MRDMASNPVAELKARTEAERSGVPFLLYRDGDDNQRLFSFERDVVQASVGRRETGDLVLDWDDQVSRLHAQFERVEQDWTVFATPATNQQVADELFLSVDAVKTHLRVLFAKFGIEQLPQNQKRIRLVERAFYAGIITERDL